MWSHHHHHQCLHYRNCWRYFHCNIFVVSAVYRSILLRYYESVVIVQRRDNLRLRRGGQRERERRNKPAMIAMLRDNSERWGELRISLAFATNLLVRFSFAHCVSLSSFHSFLLRWSHSSVGFTFSTIFVLSFLLLCRAKYKASKEVQEDLCR